MDYLFFTLNIDSTLLLITNICILLFAGLYCFCQIVHYNQFLTLKLKRLHVYLLFIVSCTSTSIISFMYFMPLFAFPIGILLLCLLLKISYKIEWLQIFFFANDFVIVLLLTGSMIPSLFSLLFLTPHHVFPEFIEAFETILVFLVATLLVYIINIRQISAEYWKYFLKKKQHCKTLLFLQIYIIFIVLIMNFAYTQKLTLWFEAVLFLTYPFIIVVYQIILNHLVKDSTANLWKFENKLYKEQLSIQMHNFEIQKLQLETLQKFKHDFYSHTEILNTLLEKNQVSEAIQFLYQITDVGKKYFEGQKSFSNNLFLQAIFNNTYQECLKQNINFEACVTVPNSLKIQEIDLCKIFSNAVRNSLEACKKDCRQNKKIRIFSQTTNLWFSLTIINTFDGIIYSENNALKTRKSDPEAHGLGMKIIKETLDVYDGLLKMKWDQNYFYTYIHIPLTAPIGDIEPYQSHHSTNGSMPKNK